MKIPSPTLAVILYKSRPLDDGTYPVKLRVTYARRPKFYALDVSCRDTDFITREDDIPYIKGKRKADNDKIAAAYKRAVGIRDKMMASGKPFSFEDFNREFDQRVNVKSAQDYIDMLVEGLRSEDRFASAFAYRDCGRSLEKYRKGIKLHEIDSIFLEKYTRYLQTSRQLSPASVGIHLRTLRAVINRAIKDRLLSSDNYPFKDFKGIPGNKARSKKALSKDRMKELFDYWRKLSRKKKFSNEWQSLGLFLFSYLVAGINLEDILRLTQRNLVADKLKFVRRKTRPPVEIEVPIHEIAAGILADFAGISKGGYLFPFLEKGLSESTIRWRKLNLLKKINSDLKAIAGDLGIPEFTFYSARHSFASVLHGQGLQTAFIGDQLGHTSEATTRNYLSSIESETQKEAFGKLL